MSLTGADPGTFERGGVVLELCITTFYICICHNVMYSTIALIHWQPIHYSNDLLQFERLCLKKVTKDLVITLS